MKIIEDVLDRLDNFFEGKKDSEFYLMVIAIVAIVGVLSYNYLIPVTEKRLKRDLAQMRSLKNKINSENRYLESISMNGDRRYKIKKLKKEIARYKIEFTNLKELNDYADYQIQTLSELLFNEKNWAKFLDSIALKAKQNNIDVYLISNKFVKNEKNFGHVLEIGVECGGSYKNMMSFLNAIEESDLVVDIYDLNMESNRSINTNFKVSVWGINY